MADNTNKVTIDAEWFAELYEKAENTEKNCMNCREKNTRGDFESIENERTELKVECLKLKKERDGLRAKLEKSQKNYCTSATGELGDACKVAALCRENEVKLAAAERCIEEIASRCDNNGLAFGLIMDIIRAYREAKEAK